MPVLTIVASKVAFLSLIFPKLFFWKFGFHLLSPKPLMSSLCSQYNLFLQLLFSIFYNLVLKIGLITTLCRWLKIFLIELVRIISTTFLYFSNFLNIHLYQIYDTSYIVYLFKQDQSSLFLWKPSALYFT